ncbi:related to molybdenum cofactor biosynthetic protein [Cephalotrichum gorgonifer]|uniref:Adenylyltransferase and sulfurtransferase uba4 n=1 Tax=Cephalotrichum gorgonifer TaxID=2041049 RepID=A0AAE8MNW1_9PEZI|nr:related to molybdenum cofactor biosynthetic protein [Cephalotrichum gorgonifer]
MSATESLRLRIQATELELDRLKEELRQAEAAEAEDLDAEASEGQPTDDTPWKWPLSADEYERYARQLIIPQVGVPGQLRLKKASVLVVGAGGLGCPAAAYLAGAGVGTIGLADDDVVEVSNLHRQIAHSTDKVGMHKVDSAIQFLRSLNPTIAFRAHRGRITSETAGAIISDYDLVLDCTDHPTSRYLISDACVVHGKPLVFASALQTHGQLMVMNYPPLPQGDPHGGPCYRCIFPKPSPPETVTSCGEGGILGPVVGVMGVLQALEAIKILASGNLGREGFKREDLGPAQMLLFSGHVAAPFRSVRMAGRRKACFACGEASGLTRESLGSGSVDYIQFCGVVPAVEILAPEERISPTQYREIAEGSTKHLLLDVRQVEHFGVSSLDGAVNVPYRTLLREEAGEGIVPAWMPPDLPATAPIYVVCRQGEESQYVTRKLKDSGLGRDGRFIGDIEGGMRAWKRDVDPTMPFT